MRHSNSLFFALPPDRFIAHTVDKKQNCTSNGIHLIEDDSTLGYSRFSDCKREFLSSRPVIRLFVWTSILDARTRELRIRNPRVHETRKDNKSGRVQAGINWLNSAGIFEASPTGNNEDSASFITTCSSTLAGRTVFSRSCSQKEEGATTISFLRRSLGRVATLRNPLSALYFQIVFTRIATTTIVATVSISFSLSPFFFLLYFLRSVHFPANRELDDEHARAHVHAHVKAIPFSCNYTWNSCFSMHEADVCLARDSTASSTSSFYFCYTDAQLIFLSRFWSDSIFSLEGKSRLCRGKSMRQLWLWPTPSMADYNKLCRWID